MKTKWIKKDLVAAYPIGTPMAFKFGYPTSQTHREHGKVTGYTNKFYRGTWCIEFTRYDGEVFFAVPVVPGTTKARGWFGATSEDALAALERADKERLERRARYSSATSVSRSS